MNDEIVAQRDKNIAHRQTEVCSEINLKSKAKTCYDPQLSPSDSCSSNCISQEFLDKLALIKTEKGSQESSENTTSGAADSAFIDDNSNFSTPYGPLTITDKPDVIQSSMSRIPMAADTPIASSMKSLNIIFPSTFQTKYEPMFLLEKIAFIYIELVVKRGYKSMTNWPFRNLARYVSLSQS
jgi:hypothetical protein